MKTILLLVVISLATYSIIPAYGEADLDRFKKPTSEDYKKEAKRIEKIINRKLFKQTIVKHFNEYKTAQVELSSVRFEKEFYGKCGVSNFGIIHPNPYPIVCNFHFPGDWGSVYTIPVRYIHFMEAITNQITISLEKEVPYNFMVYAQYHDYPVCSYWYSHEFDSLTTNSSGF